ncbi:PREDICTED: piggyBac transposable element-derived protein 4-like [Cyphomyrmex costatus]|uniref:piggyBac transposable element-derived protein 4-like n=1 Tax=Cyphomyrmex costatus TaxID=456900 RepID=UPI000852219E|nr:PREDICTED: piggyBac transposable element-derived protein 4-like [Cyphomyrmex costatus]
MTYNRFRHLLTLLHFSENEDDSTDKLRKIRSVYELLVDNFKAVYRPGKDISIDESLIPWKGRLSFRQCNRNKRARFGIKAYKNCESKTGYVYDVNMYIGKDRENERARKGIGISGTVVKTLLRDLAGQGRSLYIDNWYTSPLLCKELVDEKTNVCGTVRENRKYMPKENTKNLRVGDMTVWYTPKMAFLAWKDKKVVTMLTTMHNPAMIDTGKIDRHTKKKIMKPNVVISYNNNMGGVDKTVQSISSYETIHKTVK